MKAVITKEYGSVDVLNVENVDKPAISENEILVEVKAASVNPMDWKIRTGQLKMMTGKTPPRILGADYSGIISETGKNITSFKKGNEVFGLINGMKAKEGTYAQFVKVTENDICMKPDNCSFEEAASLPLVSVTAYKALADMARVRPGSDILINGCTGGVGSAAVQIAKALGCKTTGICSAKNIDFARKIGVDDVIDYKKDNVLEKSMLYDTIFDTVGNLTFSKSKIILNPGGIYVTTAVSLSAMIFSPMANVFRSKKLKLVMSTPDSTILNTIKKMVADEKIKGQIFKIFNLEQIKEAHEMSQNGGFSGKLVLRM